MSTYTIRQVSEMFQLPASTLRYYEELGILPEVKKTKSNQRIYTDEHVSRLGAICCFKETGMSMSKLQEFFKCEEQGQEHIDEILSLLTEQKENVIGQIEKLKISLNQINRKLCYYNDIKSAMDTGTALPDWKNYRESSGKHCP